MVLLSCLLSAGLLVLSYPKVECSFLAWFALVPLFSVIDGQKPWVALRRAYLGGFLFFFFSLGWFVYVTYAGAILLIAFLSLYFAVYGLIFVYIQHHKLMTRIFALASAWVALEFVRAHFLSGFGWVCIGHSQFRNIWLIQIADLTGVYGVSFLVVLVNLLIFETVRARTFLFQASISVALILSLVYVYGIFITGGHKHYPTVRVGIVQPNISLRDNWDDSRKPWIIERTIQLTHELKGQKLDLIVWPESSLPGTINDETFLTLKIRNQAAWLKTPLMIGSVAREGQDYYNSAFLIGTDGQMLGRYDKIHLVPFGEYLPLRPILGWICKIVPLDDFAFGRTYRIFSVTPAQKRFGALICFEDTLGYLCRNFAKEGAQFFVNLTNDAWFKDTKAPFLHLQAAVFGCVENHRSLARAANTGVSALVDPWGRILQTVHDGNGKETFIEGSAWGVLPLVREKTLYTKYGDIFTILCFLCILVTLLRRRV